MFKLFKKIQLISDLLVMKEISIIKMKKFLILFHYLLEMDKLYKIINFLMFSKNLISSILTTNHNLKKLSKN
jgi:hypothetical protein